VIVVNFFSANGERLLLINKYNYYRRSFTVFKIVKRTKVELLWQCVEELYRSISENERELKQDSYLRKS